MCVYKGCGNACRCVLLKGLLSVLLTTCCVMQAGRRSRHRRISSWDANLEGRRGVEPALISPASSGELTATRPKVHCTIPVPMHSHFIFTLACLFHNSNPSLLYNNAVPDLKFSTKRNLHYCCRLVDLYSGGCTRGLHPMGRSPVGADPCQALGLQGCPQLRKPLRKRSSSRRSCCLSTSPSTGCTAG